MAAGDEPEDIRGLKDAIKRRVYDDILASTARGRKGKAKPEGIVTIAFTDIEESSRLVSQLGDKKARALIRRHDEVLRDTVRLHEGVEIERAGDGFMVAFSTASRAVEWAIGLQRALSADRELTEGGIRVRVGMETGEVIAEEHGYFGRTVFQASRISEVSLGGHIVASEATRLVAGPEQFSFSDLGQHQLKGLDGSHRLFDVSWNEEPALSGS
jgi:class 3 adenylate cyclase